MQNPPTIRIGGQVSKSLYQFSMQSPDREELYQAARKLKKALAGRARHRGSDERPRDHQPAGQRRNRPRQGRRARRHGQPDRERVLRRLRPALGLDHLRAGQRVQGAARARAGIPDRSVRPVAALLQGDAAAGRRSYRQRGRGDHRRRRNDLGHHRRRARQRRRRQCRNRRAARHAGQDLASRRTADGQPLRPAARGHDLVRPRARRVARRRADARAERRRRDAARGGQRRSSRARPRHSKARSATSPCCWSSPSWSSTSCWASSTRATFTR